MRARLALLLAAALTGCPDASEPAAPRAEPPREAAPRPTASRAAGTEVRLRPDGRLDLFAAAAPRLHVLRALGEATGFALEPGRGRPAPRRVDLSLEGVTTEEAIAAVLRGVPYHLHYEGDAPAEPGADLPLRRVTVGELGAPERPGLRELEHLRARRLRERRDRDPAERARLREQREVREAERRREIAESRDARDPELRERAAALMRADEDAPELLAYLAGDASAAVRARAAASLADVDAGPEAVEVAGALLAALADPEPAVIASAIEALEDVHDVLPDPRIREAVAALADHPDAEVRAAAESFREWTEDE